MSDAAAYEFTIVFLDELRAASRALHALHDRIKAGQPVGDLDAAAINACLCALWHVDDSRNVLLMDSRNLYLSSGGDPRGNTPAIQFTDSAPTPPPAPPATE